MSFGNTPFHLDEPQFIHGEAVEITGVPSKTVNNWTQREVISIGTMHRTGRRLYSILDLIELKIVGELTSMVAMPPAHAAAAARWARERALQMSERDASGRLKYKGQAQEKRHYLTIWFEDGEHKIALREGYTWLSEFALPHPLIILPLDDIVLSVENLAFDVLEREHSALSGGNE